jgi:hypothetical protein
MQTCQAVTAQGLPCKGRARADGYCLAHTPSLEERRAEARVKGGEHRSNVHRAAKRLPPDLKAIIDVLVDALSEVHDGRITPAQATAMSSLAGAISKLHESADLAARIDALEQVTPPTIRRRYR